MIVENVVFEYFLAFALGISFLIYRSMVVEFFKCVATAVMNLFRYRSAICVVLRNSHDRLDLALSYIDITANLFGCLGVAFRNMDFVLVSAWSHLL
jgi:hypothetical protein